MKGFTKPDFTKSVLNVTATLAEFFNAPNQNPVLPVLKEELQKNYEKIVFILFDGMGTYPLSVNLDKDDFLLKNTKMTLTSTFPSTTTNATTSVNTNKLPLEHGWFGWIMRFNEIDKNVIMFWHCDAQTGEKLDYDYPTSESDDYWFNYAKTDYTITSVMPEFCKGYKNSIKISTVEGLTDAVKDIVEKDGKQFVFAYSPEPDSTMHEYGVTSEEAKTVIKKISERLLDLQKSTKNTLFIVTADHGQTDVKGYVEFYKDEELNDMLSCPPYLDAKTPAFYVKEEFKPQFERLFKERYGKDFELYKSKELIEEGYFGDRGEYGYLLGDYIAIGKTDKLFMVSPDNMRFKGHHTSLTEEMNVPLIIFKS